MPKPTQQQLDQWWNGLQRTLDEAGADIDLNNPGDLIRFNVIDITNKNPKGLDADVHEYFPFADKNLSMDKATDAELVSAQKTGKPDPEKLTELYNAAKEGRLFVYSLLERGASARQVVVNKSGDSEVLPDYAHPTADMICAQKTYSMPEKPKKKSIGIGTRIAALFGNKKAKREIDYVKNHKAKIDTEYAKKMDEYEKKMKEFERGKQLLKENPDFVLQVHNQDYANLNFFTGMGRDMNHDQEWAYNRSTRLQRIGAYQHKKPMIDAVVNQTKANEVDISRKLSDMMKNNGEVTPEARNLVAELCYQRMLGKHVQDDFMQELTKKDMKASDVKMTEKNIGIMSLQANPGTKEYNVNFARTCGSALFQNILNQLPEEEIRGFAQDPKKAADNVYGFCTSSVKRAATALKDAPVKQAAKDFTATHNRPQLEEIQPKKPINETPMLR